MIFNTATAMAKENRPELRKRILALLFADGFGPHEASDHLQAYCREVFGNVSATGVNIIASELRAIEREAV